MTDAPVIVVGAGPAGLAVAAALGLADVPYSLLERSNQVGHAWRHHYDRLHLHTVKKYSALPGLPMPDSYPRYPSRDQVVAYLEEYARHFNIEPQFGVDIRGIRRGTEHWILDSSSAKHRAPFLIMATGRNRVASRPAFPGLEEFAGPVIHSAEYRNGEPYRGQSVLVVGCGNSGAEIALDLAEHGAKPALVVRGPTHLIPRDMLGRPVQVTSIMLSRLPRNLNDLISMTLLKWVVGDLSPYGIVRPRLGPRTLVETMGRLPLLDVGTLAMIKAGRITVVPNAEEFTGRTCRFADGRTLDFDAVVLATGYRTGLDTLLNETEPILDGKGLPRIHGAEAGAPGLYFIGYQVTATGILRNIAHTAPRVARDIAERLKFNVT